MALIVKQPNGLLARFSQLVNDFDRANLTETEALNLCFAEYSPGTAECLVDRGMCDAPIAGFVERTADDGLDRWRQAIARIRAAHGDAVAEQRIAELSKPHDPA